MRFLLLSILICYSSCFFAQKNNLITPFEKDNQHTATYSEILDFYQQFSKGKRQVQIKNWGSTDSGEPLQTIVLSQDRDFDPISIRKKGKCILLINNGIHPGEPEGVDATMLLLRDYAKDKNLQAFLEHLVIVVIPIYNIDGCLNRNTTSRANQNGPDEYGFRGNAKNLDLNRDFIKCDTRNAQTFNQLFNYWQPDLFLDNHTSNGADYQYTMTLIATQRDKLDPNLSQYMVQQLLPRLYKDMAARHWEMTPYVNSHNSENEIPDEKGISDFLESPRFSTGYAALHNTIGFMPETHMLKPFKDRVWASYHLMDVFIHAIHDDYKAILAARAKAKASTTTGTSFDLQWKLDETQKDSLVFKGYEAKYKASAISGLPRLYYDRNAPYSKTIPYYHHFEGSLSVSKPMAYLIPKAYQSVIERLQWNNVTLYQLTKDMELNVEVYALKDFKTPTLPYESHYLHSKVEVEKKTQKRHYQKGDYVVYTNQIENRYLIHVLEPQAMDSYFAWNFFDGILMQKEYFSSYVFEDLAASYLETHPETRTLLEEKKISDPVFAKSAEAQLDWVYRQTPYYYDAWSYRIYPVARLEEKQKECITNLQVNSKFVMHPKGRE